MPDDYRISDLTTIGIVSNDDLMEISAVNQASESGYSSMKIPMTTLADKIVIGIQYASALQTTAKTIVGAINEVAQGGGAWTDLTDTLEAGETTLTFEDASITTNSTIDFYTDVFGVNPTNVVVSTGSVTLTFEARVSDLGVKVRVS